MRYGQSKLSHGFTPRRIYPLLLCHICFSTTYQTPLLIFLSCFSTTDQILNWPFFSHRTGTSCTATINLVFNLVPANTRKAYFNLSEQTIQYNDNPDQYRTIQFKTHQGPILIEDPTQNKYPAYLERPSLLINTPPNYQLPQLPQMPEPPD